MAINKQVLVDKFFTDPDWIGIEEIILSYIDPLLKMEDVDTSQPAENVKAEVIARQKAHKCLIDFLNDSKIVTRRSSTHSTMR